ncbi:hypothetical protein MMC07_002622 [Pseudocyphellaria aurata]|nr:hypothetical protein [Pseudocyphellaria aurata]
MSCLQVKSSYKLSPELKKAPKKARKPAAPRAKKPKATAPAIAEGETQPAAKTVRIKCTFWSIVCTALPEINNERYLRHCISVCDQPNSLISDRCPQLGLDTAPPLMALTLLFEVKVARAVQRAGLGTQSQERTSDLTFQEEINFKLSVALLTCATTNDGISGAIAEQMHCHPWTCIFAQGPGLLSPGACQRLQISSVLVTIDSGQTHSCVQSHSAQASLSGVQTKASKPKADKPKATKPKVPKTKAVSAAKKSPAKKAASESTAKKPAAKKPKAATSPKKSPAKKGEAKPKAARKPAAKKAAGAKKPATKTAKGPAKPAGVKKVRAAKGKAQEKVTAAAKALAAE